jgi:hypothetical protein
MENSSRDTPTNLSPDRLHPSQVDDSERGADARAGDWLVMVPAAAIVAMLWPIGFVAVRVAHGVRAWKGRADGP